MWKFVDSSSIMLPPQKKSVNLLAHICTLGGPDTWKWFKEVAELSR